MEMLELGCRKQNVSAGGAGDSERERAANSHQHHGEMFIDSGKYSSTVGNIHLQWEIFIDNGKY